MQWQETEPGVSVSIEDLLLSGKTVVLTGTLENMSRSDAKKKLQALGAKVNRGVFQQRLVLLWLVMNLEGKATKAAELGIEIKDEAALLQMLEIDS